MYCDFFKVDEEPFNLRADPKFLFLSQRHREKLAGLAYGILNHKKFLVLTGDIGTGKTTLISAVSRYLPASRARFSVIAGHTLSPSELLEMTLLNFGVKEIPASTAGRIHQLQQFCEQGDQDGKVSAVIFDEAHKLSVLALEEIRLLGNLNSLGIVLAGQTELNEVLEHPELRALKQRICLRLTVEPLQEREVPQYVHYRWKKAGGEQLPPFSQKALAAVAQYSKGVPRLINSLCDNALMSASEQENSLVEPAHVNDAANRLHLDDSVQNSNPAVSFSHPAGPDPGLRKLAAAVEQERPIEEVALPTPPVTKSRRRLARAGQFHLPSIPVDRFLTSVKASLHPGRKSH